jgi:DNA invertase Pin-like site-specific DNA recombinase
MNKIVREHYPAAQLPEELREGLPNDSVVRVTVELERRGQSKDEMLKQLELVRRTLPRFVTVEEAVARVRELRDEWDM